MEWYDHLLGALAILTCINWIIIMSAIHVGAKADERSEDHSGACVQPTITQERSTSVITRSLDKVTSL